MLIERVEQGTPVECLDLRGCEEPTPPRVEQIFAEIVVDVEGPVDLSWTMGEWDLRASFLTRVRLPQEVEYDDDWHCEFWYGLD